MPIRIEEDYDQIDGGHAVLTLPASLGDGDGRFRIKRLAGEPDKLGVNGWQPHDAVLTPASVAEANGRSVMYLGPDLTQHLMEDTELEISIPALNLTERIVWPYITPSVHADASRGAMAGITQAPAVLNDPSQGVEPVGTDGPDDTGDDDPIDEVIVDPVDPVDPIETDPEPANRSLKWLWALPVAAALGGIAYFAFFHETVTTPVPDPTVEIIETAQDADAPEPPVVDPVDTRESLMAQAAECRAAECDGAVYFDIAIRLQGIGVNDVFAVMSLAADGGSVEALEWLARSYDPLHFEANEGLAAPDLGSAFLYYSQAVEAGSNSADAAKSALCSALENPTSITWPVASDAADIRAARERNCQ